MSDHRTRPSVPQDLHNHSCIGYRVPWDGSLAHWVFAKGDQRTELAVEGPLVVNDIDSLLNATIEGVGVAYLPEPVVSPHIARGRLVRLLNDWSNTVPGVFLYHPSRRQPPMPLQVFLKYVEKWRKQAVAANRVPRLDQIASRHGAFSLAAGAQESEARIPEAGPLKVDRAAKSRPRKSGARPL